jgi:hypothetical protein
LLLERILIFREHSHLRIGHVHEELRAAGVHTIARQQNA